MWQGLSVSGAGHSCTRHCGKFRSAIAARLGAEMLETSSRLLELLSLLQARREWSGPDLADRLGVGVRTVRRDMERLRRLGYPVSATRGVAGGYRLGAGASLPPLLLDAGEGGGGAGGPPPPPRRGPARRRGGPPPPARQPPAGFPHP